MATIAGLSDSRQHGPPADIGTFQFCATAMVFKFTFSGDEYTVAIAAGVGGWTLIAQSAAGADEVEIIAAVTYVGDLGGGSIIILAGTYNIDDTITILFSNIRLAGVGPATILFLTVNSPAGTHIIMAGDDTNPYTDIRVEDLQVDGNKTNQVNINHAGIYFNQYITRSMIKGCWVHDTTTYGLWARDCYDFMCIQNWVSDATNVGIEMQTNDHAVCVSNIVENTEGGTGIAITHDSNNCVASGNTCSENDIYGILLDGTSIYNAITGNTCNGNTQNGIYASTACSYNAIVGNTCQGNTQHGIRVGILNNGNTLSGNICYQNVRHGIYIFDSDNNNITGNICNENDVNNTGTYDGICIEDDADYNFVMGNTCNDNNRWGISIGIAANDCVGNWVKNNHLRGNTSGPFSDQGTDTKLATIPLYIASYNVTDISESEDGLVVDDVGEWVSFVGQLPLEVQQVVRFEIWAVGLADPGPGNQMCLEIEIEGGAEGEAKTTHDTGALADQLSVTEDSPINDIIHWECIDAAALALLGGDSVKCACRYNAISGTDVATNAAFRRVLAHIV